MFMQQRISTLPYSLREKCVLQETSPHLTMYRDVCGRRTRHPRVYTGSNQSPVMIAIEELQVPIMFSTYTSVGFKFVIRCLSNEMRGVYGEKWKSFVLATKLSSRYAISITSGFFLKCILHVHDIR